MLPTVIHSVTDTDQASQIQQSLFLQKPFDRVDPLSRHKYNIKKIIEQFIDKLKSKFGDRTVKEFNLNSKNRQWRRRHFNIDIFTKELRNSPNIKKWADFQISYKEIYDATIALCENCFEDSLDMSRDKYMKIYGQANKNQKPIFYKFNLLTCHYYRNYQKLVNDLEYELYLINDDEENNDGSDDEFESVGNSDDSSN